MITRVVEGARRATEQLGCIDHLIERIVAVGVGAAVCHVAAWNSGMRLHSAYDRTDSSFGGGTIDSSAVKREYCPETAMFRNEWVQRLPSEAKSSASEHESVGRT